MKFKLYFIFLIISGIIFGFVYHQVTKTNLKSAYPQSANPANNSVKQNLKIFSLKELSKFDGTDPKIPIYLALDGNVYDVTKGKEFYKLGAPYHYLAGRDSSKELHLIGGEIIKRKYPIIGRFSAIDK